LRAVSIATYSCLLFVAGVEDSAKEAKREALRLMASADGKAGYKNYLKNEGELWDSSGVGKTSTIRAKTCPI